jgi:hypothetical protein
VKIAAGAWKRALWRVLLVHRERELPPLASAMINTAILRATLQQQIETIRDAGWKIDARCLQNDLDRSGECLPELLMTRDSVEEMLESITG